MIKAEARRDGNVAEQAVGVESGDGVQVAIAKV